MNYYVNASGQRINIDALAQKYKPAPKAAPGSLKRVETRDEAKQSDGFAVMGYSPERWAMRAKEHAWQLKNFKKGELGAKNPGTLEEFTAKWMAKNKPKRARSKSYEVESTADLCAYLMCKAGWQNVRVEELMKR